MVDIGRFPSVQDVSCRKKEQQPCQPAGRSVNRRESPASPICRLLRLRFFLILVMLEIDLRREESEASGVIAREQGIVRGGANQKGRPDWPFSSH
jgi:hypothetical protein